LASVAALPRRNNLAIEGQTAADRQRSRFASEEVPSEFGYPSEYRPRKIVDQIARLRELFPRLGTADVGVADQPLPANAESWYAVPRWEKIGATYADAVEGVLGVIRKTRNDRFYNYREGMLRPDRLRQHILTGRMFKKLNHQQAAHDILILPAQFGRLHRGRSIRRAREVFSESEFGLGAFTVGIMLLTHPERLNDDDDLSIDCAGDEFDYPGSATGPFSLAPIFLYQDGKLEFGTDGLGGALGFCGSASGFLYR
jgi:hypothetical protein